MDDLHQLAITALTASLENRIPEPPQHTSFDLFVRPLRLTPTGLGNYVGQHDDPQGTILGVRITAEVVVTVTVTGQAELNQAITQLTSAILAQDPTELRPEGIFRWQVASIEPISDNPRSRDVIFDVLYEFVRLPEAGEGIIETIPIDLQLG